MCQVLAARPIVRSVMLCYGRDSPTATISSPAAAGDIQQAEGGSQSLLPGVPAVFEFGGCVTYLLKKPTLVLVAQSCLPYVQCPVLLDTGLQRTCRCGGSVKWMIPIRSKHACGK